MDDNLFHLGPNGPSANEAAVLPSLLPGSRCIDLGCGSGANAVYLARLGHRVVGIDSSGNQLASAVRRARDASVEIDWFQADIGATLQKLPPGAAGSFDFAYAIFSYEYTQDIRRAFAEVVELLRPGSSFLYADLHPSVSWRSLGSYDAVGCRTAYVDEGPIQMQWPRTLEGILTTRYHRTLETLVREAFSVGLNLLNVAEPVIDHRPQPAYSDPDIVDTESQLDGLPYTLALTFAKVGHAA